MRNSLATLTILAALSAAPGAVLAAETPPAKGVIVVPADYHAKTQPKLFAGALVLTTIRNSGSYSDKYHAIYKLLSSDKKLDEIGG